MRSLLLVAFGVLVLSSAWWWQQRSMSDCCLQVVEPVIMIEEPDAEPLPPVAKPAPPVVLDLTVPADVVSGEPLPENGDNRFGSEQWFAPKEKTESSVTFKSKLLMKDGVELQRDMGNYQEAIDGAEMGIEYKTR